MLSLLHGITGEKILFQLGKGPVEGFSVSGEYQVRGAPQHILTDWRNVKSLFFMRSSPCLIFYN